MPYSKILSITPVSIEASAPKAGDKVTINDGAINEDNGNKFESFVYEEEYEIISINDDGTVTFGRGDDVTGLTNSSNVVIVDTGLTADMKEDAVSTPEVDKVKGKEKHHYIFFDTNIRSARRSKNNASAYDALYADIPAPGEFATAIGIQLGVAQHLGKYKGGLNISKKGMKTLNKTVHLVPLAPYSESTLTALDDTTKEITYTDSDGKSVTENVSYGKKEYSTLLSYITESALDGTLSGFQTYWNNNIAASSLGENKEIGIITFWLHGNHKCIDLNDKTHQFIETNEIDSCFSDIPDMDCFLFVSCNVGEEFWKEERHPLSAVLSTKTQIKNGVIACDGLSYNSYNPSIDKRKNAQSSVADFDINNDGTKATYSTGYSATNKGYLCYHGEGAYMDSFDGKMERVTEPYEEDSVEKIKISSDQDDIYALISAVLNTYNK